MHRTCSRERSAAHGECSGPRRVWSAVWAAGVLQLLEKVQQAHLQRIFIPDFAFPHDHDAPAKRFKGILVFEVSLYV